MVNDKTGELSRSNNYKERYAVTLTKKKHNQLRIRRILAHLNIVGFRTYAIELVKFLEKEIYG